MTFAQADKAVVFCDLCDDIMHRVPQMVRVNWNGLPPHEADRRPKPIQDWLNNADNARAQYIDTERKK